MLKKWVYIIVLVILIALGLAIGAANDSVVMFDFLIVTMQVNLATVLVIGLIFGLLLGIYLSMLMCFKFWRQSHGLKSELKALKRSKASLEESSKLGS